MQSSKKIGRVILAGLILSASASAADGDVPGLPWTMAGNHHVLIGVVWNEAVLKIVPKGLSATPERTGGINIYYSPRGYGAAPYQSGYGWLDLAGQDSADGTKARYIFRAGVGPTENITKAFAKIWGSGVKNGGTKLESEDGVLKATGTMSGKVWGTVKIKTSDQCQNASGTLHYFIPSPDGSKLSRMQLPYTTISCGAEPIAAEINFPDTDVAGVKPEKLIWAAELKESAFGFTQPVVWK